jgi:hypothetical protein
MKPRWMTSTGKLVGVAIHGLFSGLFLRIGRVTGVLVMGVEHVSIARVLLELRLQDDEEKGLDWEPTIIDSYHWLCWLEGIRGYDLLSLSLLEEVQRMDEARGLSGSVWIRKRIQRRSCPSLRDTSRDKSSPRARSLWRVLHSFFLENVIGQARRCQAQIKSDGFLGVACSDLFCLFDSLV